MLKIAIPTCTIGEEFKTSLKDMMVAKAKDLFAKRKTTNSTWLEKWDKDYGVPLAKLMKITQNAAAFDDELTRLKSLPYTNFGVYGGYLVGSTNPVEIVDRQAFERGVNMKTGVVFEVAKKWDAGVYDVFIPISIATSGLDTALRPNSNGVHLVPRNAPWTKYRHPHHLAEFLTCDDDGDKVYYSHPTKYTSKTCWGSYATIVTSCVMGGDFVDMFRTLHSYLTRYDRNSPLASIGAYSLGTDFKWLKEIV
jgi:hypothetical protein